MATEKKLKLGLSELSVLFQANRNVEHQAELRPLSPVRSPLVIEPPIDFTPDDNRLPQLICTTFLPFLETFGIWDIVRIADSLKTAFEDTYVLSVDPEDLSGPLKHAPLPALTEDNGVRSMSMHLHSMSDRLVFGQVAARDLQNILRPSSSVNQIPEIASERKTLVLFDAVNPENLSRDFVAQSAVFEFLDHCVLVLPPRLEELMRAYQLLRLCIERNRALRYSLFIVGPEARSTGEFVYERFSELVSRFLGRDVGFLGWAEEGDIRLNPELLLEEAGSLMQSSTKIRLSEAMYHFVLPE